MEALDYAYRYARESAVEPGPKGPRLRLAAAEARETPFFSGRLESPRRTADLLLCVAHVAGARFYTPPNMLARLIALADPLIVRGGEFLRFESFSACRGVYCRLDLPPQALEAEAAREGCTNVDFNAPMRTALTRIRDGDTVRIEVEAGGVSLESERAAAVERKVQLPLYWLRGFASVQAAQAEMSERLRISGAEALRLLRDTPRTRTGGPVFVSRAGSGARFSTTGGADSVRVGGIERLKALTEALRHARSLRVFAADDGSTAWLLETPDSRLTMALSPEPSRGFSGEGKALMDLAAPAPDHAVARLRAADIAAMSAGMAGFDLAEGAPFRRWLPFDTGTIETMYPRLRDARELVRQGRVRIENGEAWVAGSNATYPVRRAGGKWRCLCQWFARHGVERGYCKHILAASIVLEGESS